MSKTENKVVDNSMDKKVYGVLGVSSIMANMNADFTGTPKSTGAGKIFGSDKALKYPMKVMWNNEGNSVFYLKSHKFDGKGKDLSLLPRTLEERYYQLHGDEKLKKGKGEVEVLKNLFKSTDIRQFGATFAATVNTSITGAVQIGQGFNKYEDTSIEIIEILSPFKNPNKEEAGQSSLGTKVVTDYAYYMYPFTINPFAYKEFVEMGITDGYTEEDYNDFHNAALAAVTAFDTNAKLGCSNDFALFVETELYTYLPTLSEYITFDKNNEKNVITLKCSDFLSELGDRVKNVEVYYNPYTTVLENVSDNMKLYNIITKKEVK